VCKPRAYRLVDLVRGTTYSLEPLRALTKLTSLALRDLAGPRTGLDLRGLPSSTPPPPLCPPSFALFSIGGELPVPASPFASALLSPRCPCLQFRVFSSEAHLCKAVTHGSQWQQPPPPSLVWGNLVVTLLLELHTTMCPRQQCQMNHHPESSTQTLLPYSEDCFE